MSWNGTLLLSGDTIENVEQSFRNILSLGWKDGLGGPGGRFGGRAICQFTAKLATSLQFRFRDIRDHARANSKPRRLEGTITGVLCAAGIPCLDVHFETGGARIVQRFHRRDTWGEAAGSADAIKENLGECAMGRQDLGSCGTCDI